MANNSSDDYKTYNEYKAGILIWKIVPPILILLGTVGNCLSIVVLTRRSIRSSTTALYLTVLAFSDLLVLYSGLLRQWLRFLFETDVRHVSEFGCKLNIWLVYNSLDFSAWILLMVTLERVVSAWLPHNAKTLCTKKSAIALLITVGICIALLNAHLLYGMVFKYKVDENVRYLEKCVEIDDNYSDFFNITWPWIDLCAFCVIPFAVIVIGNGLILFKVIKSQRRVKSRVVPSIQGGGRQAHSNHSSKQSSMTAMLVTLNVVFLLSTSPISIYNVGYTYWEKDATAHDWAQLDLWWAVVNMFMYVNNSLNFLLYCLSGSRFRQEVIRLFTSCKYRVNGSNLHLAHTNFSRSKFDTPSPSPSPRHSVKTSNNETPLTNVISLRNGTGDQNGGDNHLGHSNNSLHPNDALRPVNNVSSIKGTDVENKDTEQPIKVDHNNTIALDNMDGRIVVQSKNETSFNIENKTVVNEPVQNANKAYEACNVNTDMTVSNESQREQIGTSGDNETIHFQTNGIGSGIDNETLSDKLGSVEKNAIRDSTV